MIEIKDICFFSFILIFIMNEQSNEVNKSGWHALVKYKSDNITEIVPINKIKIKIGKGERISFNPKSLTDFNKTEFYTVNTAHSSKDGKEHKWYAIIGLLAESREELEHAIRVKRVSWPIMLSDGSSEPNSTDNDVLEQASSNVTIFCNRDLNRNKKKTKKDAINAIHAKLLASRSLNASNESMSIQDDVDVGTRSQENEELTVLKANRKRNNSPGDVEDYANAYKNCLQRIEEKMEKMQENFQEILDNARKMNLEKFADLEKKMANIEKLIRMRSSLSSTSSATSEVSYTEEKVPLGDGVFCSKAAYKELINVEESHADWAYALLKGVFGEKAHLMRVRINSKNTENERFSSNFLMVAKALHRDWLVKQKIQDKNGQLCPKYSATEVEKYVNGLPAYLADRAYDMQGPRGNARKKSGDHAPKRKQSEEPKRKYIRRGQPLLEIQQHLLPECNTQSLPLQQSLSQHQLLQQQPQESSYQQQQLPHCSQQPFDYSSYFMQPSTSGTFENLESASTTFTIL